MKKSKLFFVAIALGMAFISSCAMEDICKDCDVVVYDVDSGIEKDRHAAAEYCGDDLEELENGEPQVVGLDSTVYECHE